MFKEAEVDDEVYSTVFGHGKIVDIHKSSYYPIRVSFGIKGSRLFTVGGKYNDSDFGPSLFWKKPKLQKRPDGKKKVKIERWINVYPDADRYTGAHMSKAKAISNQSGDCIATIKLKGSYKP